VAKVKKRAEVTGVRNVKAGNVKTSVRAGRPKPKAAKTPAHGASVGRPRATKKTATRGAAKKGTMKKTMKKELSRKDALALLKVTKGRPLPAPPVVRVAVRELDPQRKCGAGTSVQFLYRVDETVDGRSTAHLVFFDRHGWYCEHGRTCPAVGHARKHNGQVARVS
jgi:hypothetical protein